MYIAKFHFDEVLDWFYCESQYGHMLLFAGGLDISVKNIYESLIKNAKRIDRVLGHRICFFYFVNNHYSIGDEDNNAVKDFMRVVSSIRDLGPFYDAGLEVNVETTEQICEHFHLYRTDLPAFILISKHREQAPLVYSIHDYDDFEIFLTPINILNSYIEDKNEILSYYESCRQKILSDYNAKRKLTIVSQADALKRRSDIGMWKAKIRKLERQKKVLPKVDNIAKEQIDIKISELNKKIEENPMLVVCGEDESVPYPQEELDNLRYPDEQLRKIRNNAVERLNIALNSQDGLSLIDSLQDDNAYSAVISRILKKVATRDVRISNIIERIRYEIREFGFDVFISCKSQDYEYAREIYSYLKHNGLRPFLADMSIKEVGIDQYTALIGEVINVCQNMVVFATNVDYLQTPYVVAEWHAFINDINTGHKPNAKIVTVLSPDVDIHSLPAWLRDKQCFTTNDYQDNLVHFLTYNDHIIYAELREDVERTYQHCVSALNATIKDYIDGKFDAKIRDVICDIEREHKYLNHRIEESDFRFRFRENQLLKQEVEITLSRWKEETDKIVWYCERQKRQEELLWDEVVHSESRELLIRFIEQYPESFHIREACTLLEQTAKCRCCIAPNAISDTDSVAYYSSTESQKTFEPQSKGDKRAQHILSRLFGNRNKPQSVYSSVFAPAEIALKQHLMVQVYLHLPEETEKVKSLASEADKNAERRGYEPLEVPLKKGDNVEIELNVNGDNLLYRCRKSVIWQGSFVKRAFDFIVPSDIKVPELSCSVNIFVNGAIAGELIFLTSIVDSPRQLNTNVYARPTKKLFISYSHKDIASAEKIAKIHEALGIDVFFDKHRLKAGYIYSEEISKFIQNADTFVLCWSENAAKSDYVEKERQEALSLAYPQRKPMEQAQLRIHSYNIEPHAVPPADMIEHYHFEEL